MKLFFYCKSLFKKLRERREREEGRERKEGEGGKVMEDEAERGNDVILGGYKQVHQLPIYFPNRLLFALL